MISFLVSHIRHVYPISLQNKYTKNSNEVLLVTEAFGEQQYGLGTAPYFLFELYIEICINENGLECPNIPYNILRFKL